jgi:signal transduction histidine kinase
LILWADPEQMQQVLVNLLSNALAATPSGGEVLLSAEQHSVDPVEAEEWRRIREEVPGNVAVLSVDDNGCGMPPEHVRQTVEPFFTTKEIGKGSGLGLFLSREIVKAHGGRLLIHSEVGKGTKVLIALPMDDRADRAA